MEVAYYRFRQLNFLLPSSYILFPLYLCFDSLLFSNCC